MPTSPETSGTADGGPRPGPRERLSAFLLKPPDPSRTPSPESAGPRSVEDIEHANRYASDKERLIGLLAAPLAALIAILVVGNKLSQHPKDPSIYNELLGVYVVIAVVMLATAWYRKRLYLGVVTALYGLSLFTSGDWGFGVPYLMVGAWLLVRAYRAQRDLREATGEGPSRPGSTPSSTPRANRRYTPPSLPPKRPSKPTSDDD